MGEGGNRQPKTPAPMMRIDFGIDCGCLFIGTEASIGIEAILIVHSPRPRWGKCGDDKRDRPNFLAPFETNVVYPPQKVFRCALLPNIKVITQNDAHDVGGKFLLCTCVPIVEGRLYSSLGAIEEGESYRYLMLPDSSTHWTWVCKF